MLVSYLPILILLLVVMGFAVSNLILSASVGRQKPSAEKLSPYECGVEPTGTARDRFRYRSGAYSSCYWTQRIRQVQHLSRAAQILGLLRGSNLARWNGSALT